MTISSEQEFNRFSISAWDFEQACRYLAAAQNYLPNSVEYEALLFAGIVSYARPFSSNERDANARAARRVRLSAFEPLSDEERKLHDRCILLRDKALAHSEIELNPTRLNSDTGVVKSRP